MAEWWTYRPSDFLMFSARSYGRLVENYNRDLWPAQPVVAILALVGVVLIARDAQRWGRPAVALLAVAWAWVAWAFHWERFATINTAAVWFAGAFALQAVALLALAARPGLTAAPRAVGAQPPWPPCPPVRRAKQGIGLALALGAVVGYPLLALAAGRGWREGELPGLLSDPTALFTLGVLLAAPLRGRAMACVIPGLVLAIGWTTAWLLWA